MVFFWSKAFEDLAGNPNSADYLSSITEVVYAFMILGAIVLVAMTAQSTLMELAAADMTRAMKTSWFEALLRQDMAYYDIQDVSGQATIISANAIKYRSKKEQCWLARVFAMMLLLFGNLSPHLFLFEQRALVASSRSLSCLQLHFLVA